MLDARDHQRRLPDGRVQQWIELGPSHGEPILFCHGGNDCRLEALWIADEVLRAGVRLITPDRPGFAGSTHDPHRTFSSWVADAEALLDHLGLDRVRVLGLSGGGPHALALAAGAPTRVVAVDLVASPRPWDTPGFLTGTWLPIRIAYVLARYAPTRLLTAVQRAMNNAERNMRYASRMPAPDARLLAERPKVATAIVTSVTAAHAGSFEGAVHEWRLYVRGWGFDLADVHAPVRLWYGDTDGMAPVAMGRDLADRLPRAELHVIEDRAHLSIFVQEAARFLAPHAPST